MKFTMRMRTNGELAMRNASEAAQRFYLATERLDVYEYEVDIYEDDEIVGEEKLYAYDWCGEWKIGLEFERLEEEFEELARLIEEVED